ncbi:MAG: DUF441 domain-containing protein [Thermaerobacter sp.]|nr:DUF441 domain-containing protein [Thermaerobacter sp.]
MSREVAVVLMILALGVFGRNSLITVAALATLILMVPPLDRLLPLVANYGIRAGLFLLMIAVLAELALGRVPIGNLAKEIWSVDGLFAILGGIIASWMSARGIELLAHRPQVSIGLVIGSVIAASFLGGVPIGPIFAAGLTALGLGLWQIFFG